MAYVEAVCLSHKKGIVKKEQDQVLAGNGRVAAVIASERPRNLHTGQRVLARLPLPVEQRVGLALGNDRIVVQHAGPAV